jgi:tetratricopeptide (TPR) repeat protein
MRDAIVWPLFAALFVALVAATSAGIARAQESGERPRDAFEAGERAFEAHDYQSALAHFRRAFALAPHDAVRFNVAVCYERLARFREALAEYDAAAASTTLDASWRARATAQARRIRPWLATLVVDGPRTGAAVLVEGEERCTVPCSVEVDPRELVVAVRDAGGEETHRIAPTRGGRTTLTLLPLAARVDPGGGRTITPGPLTVIGAISLGLGAGGIVGFGIRAQDLHAAYDAVPRAAFADEGELMRDLANVSIAIASVGAVLVAIDLLFLSGLLESTEESGPVAIDASGLGIRF